MFQEFPYTDMHQLNLDWIVKIAKDFLDQYTHIQDLISQGIIDIGNKTDDGLNSLTDKTTESLASLENKKEQLEALLNAWYELHQNYLDQTLATNTATFNRLAEEKTAQSIASIPADYTTLSNMVDSLIAIIQSNISTPDYGIQLVDPLSSDYHAGKYWQSNGGLADGGNSYVAVKIPVTPGERYCANFYPSFTYFWNETAQTGTQVTLQYYADYHETDIGEIYIPANTTHLLASLAKTATSNPILFKEFHQYFYKPNNFFVEYGKPIIDYPTMDNRFKGCKYFSFGDSITYYDKHEYINTTSVAGSMCQGYQTYIQAITGFDSYNHGLSGGDSNDILEEVQNTDVSTAKLVTIMTGINDFGRDVSITTFKQNLRNMIYKIQTDNPRCLIVLLSNTFGHFDNKGYVTRDYADAMKEVAIESNIPFIDNMNDNGINANNLQYFIADLPVTTYALHPNCDGFARIGKQIAARIRDLLA